MVCVRQDCQSSDAERELTLRSAPGTSRKSQPAPERTAYVSKADSGKPSRVIGYEFTAMSWVGLGKRSEKRCATGSWRRIVWATPRGEVVAGILKSAYGRIRIRLQAIERSAEKAQIMRGNSFGEATVLRTIRKLVKRGRKALREKHRDSRWAKLMDAGRRLLAVDDYDNVSIAKIAATADCSVGSFYGRFSDKKAFLTMLVQSACNSAALAADRVLDPAQWEGASGATVAGAIVRHVVGQARGESAGVLRTAVKLGRTDPAALRALLSYRDKVTDKATALLSHHLPKRSGAEKSIRAALQIVHGTVMDAVLHQQGPLQLDGDAMVDALRNVMIGHLGLRGESRVPKGERARLVPKKETSATAATSPKRRLHIL